MQLANSVALIRHSVAIRSPKLRRFSRLRFLLMHLAAKVTPFLFAGKGNLGMPRPPHRRNNPVPAGRGSGISSAGHAGGQPARLNYARDGKARESQMKILYFDDFKLGVLKGDSRRRCLRRRAGHPAYRPGRSDQRPDRALRAATAASSKQAAAQRRRACRCRACASVRRCRSRPTSTAWRSTTWKTARAARRRRSTPSTNRPSAIIGHGDTMVLPDVPATIFEGEAETGGRHRQARQQCQRRRRDGLHLRLHELHRRLGARSAAAGQVSSR